MRATFGRFPNGKRSSASAGGRGLRPVERGVDGDKLDESKWERFTFEGTGGGKLEVRAGQVHIRSANGTRSGIRTKQSFSGSRYSVEAQIAKVGPAMPAPNEKAAPLGFGGLTILFDSTGRNRVEWILTSEGTFEAWSIVDGRGERLDNRKLWYENQKPGNRHHPSWG